MSENTRKTNGFGSFPAIQRTHFGVHLGITFGVTFGTPFFGNVKEIIGFVWVWEKEMDSGLNSYREMDSGLGWELN